MFHFVYRGLLKYDNSQAIYRVQHSKHGDITCWKGFGLKGNALLQGTLDEYFLHEKDWDAMGYGENSKAMAGTTNNHIQCTWCDELLSMTTL